MTQDAFLYDALRTPRGAGKPSGSLHEVKPIDLVVGLTHALRDRHEGLDPADIEDMILGCVSPVGDQGAVLPRVAALKAGLPQTVAGVQLTTMVVGAVVIESVFVIPGIGSMLLEAVSVRDLTTVQTLVMLLVAFALVVNAFTDVAYRFIDPRITAGEK